MFDLFETEGDFDKIRDLLFNDGGGALDDVGVRTRLTVKVLDDDENVKHEETKELKY